MRAVLIRITCDRFVKAMIQIAALSVLEVYYGDLMLMTPAITDQGRARRSTSPANHNTSYETSLSLSFIDP